MTTDLFAPLQQYITPWLTVIANDPVARGLQGLMLLLGLILIFIVFYTTRDILLRTQSFIVMILYIVLVSALPIVGFLIYLLVRPPRTIKEREMYKMLEKVLEGKKGPASK